METVGFLLLPGYALMSYAAAVEPLRAANLLSGRPLYRWWTVSPDDGAAPASNGIAVTPDRPLGSDREDPDLLLVCAGGNPASFMDPRALGWLRRLARRGVTVGGISGGPFILARAGLLEGRRCTIHWEHVAAFEETFPEIPLARTLFELDGKRITCAGGIAALDMMVALIARDHGAALAQAVGDWFLQHHPRDGAEPQRMDPRFRLGVTDEKLLRALTAMETHIEDPLSRDALANHAGCSLRRLERAFAAHLGRGIHDHYLALRLARARQLMRETTLPLMEIAVATGFGSASQFSRAFRRAFGAAPRVARG